ncbi:MAG TPA: FGGY-family carbohydrate kinase, partial [Solirubrobacteraceae bacterium]|nr:FGGY-family carbohydrate kinase [Solirubrobacteraceae bacterium]
LWNDQRTASDAEELEARLGGVEATVAATGNRMLTGFTAPKLAWMARCEPELHRQIRSVLLPKDYVRLRLCGEHAIDVVDASGTGWFDVAARSWSAAPAAVDADWLPEVMECGAISGRTPDGVPVAAGAGDQGAGALGVGAVDEGGPASVVLGTSGVVCAPAGAFAADPLGRLQASCHVVPDGWFLMGVMLSAAGSLAWLASVVGAGEPVLVEEAAGWEPGVEGLTFLPYLSGERAPHLDPAARGAFAGLSIRHDRGALARAVLEGVAFGLRDSLDLVRETGVEVRSARLSGGGVRSWLWSEIVASVLGVPLEVVEVPEAAAYGAALLGGVAAGVWESAGVAADACIRPVAVVSPRTEWVERYAELHRRYRALYPPLRDWQEESA